MLLFNLHALIKTLFSIVQTRYRIKTDRVVLKDVVGLTGRVSRIMRRGGRRFLLASSSHESDVILELPLGKADFQTIQFVAPFNAAHHSSRRPLQIQTLPPGS